MSETREPPEELVVLKFTTCERDGRGVLDGGVGFRLAFCALTTDEKMTRQAMIANPDRRYIAKPEMFFRLFIGTSNERTLEQEELCNVGDDVVTR